MSQRSQVSSIALCMAKVKVSELVTRSPIELFWTAKKGQRQRQNANNSENTVEETCGF